MQKKRNFVIGIIFILMIVAIPTLTILKMLKNGIPLEQYQGALVGRFKMISLNTDITSRLTGGTYMESSEVLLGKENWLFYKVTSDGEPIYDYMGIKRFTADELDKALNSMKKANRGLADRGIDFAVMTIPNKEQVYSEYMPDTISKISDESKLSQLTEYIEPRADFVYLDVSKLMLENKQKYPVFYKTDTHWTEKGSFIALQALMQRMYGKSESIKDVTFSELAGFQGDLPRISGTSDRFSEISYSLDDESVDKSLYRDETLLIIGDSFGDSMLHTAKHYFKDVKWIRVYDFTEDMLDEIKPDIVLWECVERYLQDMADYDIID